MSKVTHYLVTDSTAEEVERKTGLRGHNTPLGTLIEKPKLFDLRSAMTKIDRALNPSRCICGKYAIIHLPNCPVGMQIT